MITIQNLSLQFGKKHLFRDVSAQIGEQDRVGLVGVNGAGKSTLLKILSGIQETDPGVIARSRLATIGYLPQEVDQFPPGRSILQEAETAFEELFVLHEELKKINLEFAHVDPESAYFSQLLKQQGTLQQQLDDSDFFEIRAKTEKVLVGLGFKEKDFHQDCNSFSGGWRMRLMLAKLLLRHPAFLFLDEPTNHLDIESLTWLEDFLKNYRGAMVIISHDQSFLDNLTTQTWELSLGNLTCYRGNFSAYRVEKAQRMEIQQAAYDNQQARIQQTMRFVTRFRAKSTKAKQVQSRLKQLSKMELIEIEGQEQTIAFRFPPAMESGRMAVSLAGVSKSFPGSPVFQDVTFDISRGDKVAIVGVNGAGKSTLVKLLSGLHTQDSGEIRFGHNVRLSYFGQHQAAELDPRLTVLQTLELTESTMTTTQLRSLLGAFLFQGDDVDKKVMVLSGGEKSRLALAKMIATPANLLIMDEPTNHLDLNSQAVLQEALNQYDGSILVVSHSRCFLDAFVNRVLEVKDGAVTLHEGTLSEYLERRNRPEPQASPSATPKTPTRSGLPGPEPPSAKSRGKEARREQARVREERAKQLKPLKTSLAKLEEEIDALETAKKSLEAALADPALYHDQDAFADTSQNYRRTEEKLGRLMAEWETLQAKIEAAEAELSQG